MGAFDKAFDYVMQNFRTLIDAPIVFAAVLLIAFAASYWFNGLRYQGTLDQKQSTIDMLKAQNDGLQDRLKDVQQKLADRPAAAPQVIPARDPDGIYQLGMQVGSADMAQTDESHGVVTFGRIIGAVKLNVDRNLEYRDFVLRFKSMGAETRASMSGQSSRMLVQVTCEIVGRVAH